MMIDALPRFPLAVLPTPITELHLPGTPTILLKRDDLTGFGVSGNKARPLEYLVGQAQHEGCELMVGGGAPTSNFIAALALAARVAGLGCELLVPSSGNAVSASASTTLGLAVAAGAVVIPVDEPREELDRLIRARAEELHVGGTAALAVPRGGATPAGSAGFVRAALEVVEQCGREPLTVVVPVGSGGSVAGLAAGAALAGAPWRLVGVSVSRPLTEMESLIRRLSADAAALGGGSGAADVELLDARHATGHDDDESAAAALDSAGVLLDSHYGVRALPVARRLAASGERVLLWHTGGLPSALELATRMVAR